MKSFLETWRPVVGYEGLYEVSDFGEVRSLGMWTNIHGGFKRFLKGRVLKLRKNKDGYLYLNLCNNGKRKTHKAHRLVAQAFIPNPDNLPEVNHKDECKTNNHVDNLEWCTTKYNLNYGTHQKRSAEARRGVKRPYISEILRNDPRQSKKVLQLTLDGVIVKEWPSTAECGRNGFNQGAIWLCCNNKYGLRKNVYKDYIWMFAEDYYKQVA